MTDMGNSIIRPLRFHDVAPQPRDSVATAEGLRDALRVCRRDMMNAKKDIASLEAKVAHLMQVIEEIASHKLRPPTGSR